MGSTLRRPGRAAGPQTDNGESVGYGGLHLAATKSSGFTAAPIGGIMGACPIQSPAPIRAQPMTWSRQRAGRKNYYVDKLPRSMQEREEWQAVMEVLLSAVEGREPVRLAQVALSLALQESKPMKGARRKPVKK
jgi:hypothetical protein